MAEPLPGLALLFQRRFLAARPLRSLPWPVLGEAGRGGRDGGGTAALFYSFILFQELEQSLSTAPDSALLLLGDILGKVRDSPEPPAGESPNPQNCPQIETGDLVWWCFLRPRRIADFPLCLVFIWVF